MQTCAKAEQSQASLSLRFVDNLHNTRRSAFSAHPHFSFYTTVHIRTLNFCYCPECMVYSKSPCLFLKQGHSLITGCFGHVNYSISLCAVAVFRNNKCDDETRCPGWHLYSICSYMTKFNKPTSISSAGDQEVSRAWTWRMSAHSRQIKKKCAQADDG